MAGLAAGVACIGGCQIGQLIGGMAASAERAGSRMVKPKYSDLKGKDFAVIVAADRSIQADFPEIVASVCAQVTQRLIDHADASGVVPAEEVLKYQSRNPGWVAKPLDQLAKDLEAQRLVYIDLQDFALTEPGNPYIYAGVVAGTVNVVESDTETPSVFAFTESIKVKYPDSSGMSPTQIPRQTVLAELVKRFVDRASWMFYEHEEPNAIKY